MLLKFGFFGRAGFAAFLNERLLTGFAVEIGTHQGDFAREFLDRWHGQKLFCIDPWENTPGYERQAKYLWNSESRIEDYKLALFNLDTQIFMNRCTLITGSSPAVLSQTAFPPLDFVFVDGDHEEAGVYADLVAWWDRIKPGGIIAGHDIVMPGEPEPLWDKEIQNAAFRFCEEKGVDLYFVPEKECLPWSFYIEKPKDVK